MYRRAYVVTFPVSKTKDLINLLLIIKNMLLLYRCCGVMGIVPSPELAPGLVSGRIFVFGSLVALSVRKFLGWTILHSRYPNALSVKFVENYYRFP